MIVPQTSCCGDSADERGPDSEALGTDWTGGGYSAEELGGLPEAAGAASLGCGNPTALTTLSPGEVVLDLGSGGIDVLLSTKRDEYAALLRETGFEAVSVEVTHTYERDFDTNLTPTQAVVADIGRIDQPAPPIKMSTFAAYS